MILGIILIAGVVGFLLIVALQPDRFSVTRSTVIKAPPEAVFVHVNNLHQWEAWSPWAKLDPAAKNSYAGPEAGVGAVFNWSGNQKVGEGRMTIIESRPPELIRFNLDFIRPFAGTCSTEFTFKPEGERTLVTWTMSGKNNFMAKVMGLFMNCGKMVGQQFEQGLSQMKRVVEVTAKPEPAIH